MVSDPGDNSTDNSDSVDICQEEGPTELFPEKHTKGYETRSNKTEMASSPDHVEAEERAFVDNLYRFMKDRGSPIERIPHLGFKQINLWKIYKAVEAMGGYDTVTGRRLWKNVYDELGGSPGSTSAATCTRKHYERLILPFERQLRGEEYKPLPQSKPRKLYKKSPDVKKSKAEGKTKRKVTQREEKTTSNKETAQRHPSSGFLQDRPQSHNNKQFGAHETSGFIKLESPRDVSLIVPSSGPAGVISPLEKKKLMAQASLCVLQSPKVVADCDSGGSTFVIHRSPPSPGVLTQGSARNSSDGSPLPPSSPSVSCSLSPSPGSVSSEEHPQQATEATASGSVTDTKRGTQLKTPPVAVGHSAPRSPPPPPQSSHLLHKPLSRHPTRLESLHQRQGVFQTCSSSQLTATTLALDARKRYTSQEIYTPPSEKQGQPSQHPVLKKNKMTPSWTSSASSFTRVVPRSRDVASLVSTHPFHKAAPLMFEPTYEAYMRHEQELRHQPRKTQTFSPLHSSVGKKDKGIHVWHGPLPSMPLLHHSSIGLQVPYVGSEHHIKGLRSPHSFLSPTYLPIAHLNSHHQPLFMPAGASVPILHEYPLQSNPLTPPFGPPLAGHYPYSSNTRL